LVGVGVAEGVVIADAVGVAAGVGDVGVCVASWVAVAVAAAVATDVALGVGVGVGVGGGAVPNASPDSSTFWGLAAASSVSINVPVSLLDFEVLAAGGLNVTETGQVPPAGRVPRQFWLAVNPALAAMPLISSATGFLFVNVTSFDALEVPRCVLGNESVCGLNCSAPSTPDPLRPTGLALLPPESVTVSVLLRTPTFVGVKVTPTEHFLPGAKAVPLQPLGSLTAKSPGSVPPRARVAIVAG
jgi:hypothetical protein